MKKIVFLFIMLLPARFSFAVDVTIPDVNFKNALLANPTDAYINKELIYAQIKSGQLEKASATCKNALAICQDKTYNAENCYNLLIGGGVAVHREG